MLQKTQNTPNNSIPTSYIINKTYGTAIANRQIKKIKYDYTTPFPRLAGWHLAPV